MSSYQQRVAERDKYQAQLQASQDEVRRLSQQIRQSKDESHDRAAELEIQLALVTAERDAAKKQRDQVDISTPMDESDDTTLSSISRTAWCPPPGYEKVGNHLYINLMEQLGEGSSGTAVFKGYFDCATNSARECAVKRIIKSRHKQAEREIEVLLGIDDHQNVVKYYHKEEDTFFIYLALQLCEGSLDDFVTNYNPSLSGKQEIIRQILTGLNFLHSKHYSHRDIKPANVLWVFDQAPVGFCMKLADFGFAKQLNSSTAGASVVARSTGWQPAEVLDYFDAVSQQLVCPPIRPKLADIFSLGCLIFWLFSGRHHLFGGGILVDSHISKNQPVNVGKGLVPVPVEDLVIGMINTVAEKRTRISDCLLHPALWSTKEALGFIASASSAIQALEASDKQTVENKMKSIIEPVTDWIQDIDKLLWTGSKRTSYEKTSAIDLVRFVRNKTEHFKELPQDLKQQLKSSEGLFEYFVNLFPKLVLVTFKVLAEMYCTPATEFLSSEDYLKQSAEHSKAEVRIPSLNRFFGGLTIRYLQELHA